MRSLEGRVLKELEEHFQGKEFSAKDVAARVGCSGNCAMRWLMETRGVRLVREEAGEQARGKSGQVKPRRVFTFKVVGEGIWTRG